MRQIEFRDQRCLIQDAFLVSDGSSVLPGLGFKSLCLPLRSIFPSELLGFDIFSLR